MAKHIVSITVNAQGASDDYDEARGRALQRLVRAAKDLNAGNAPADPGVNVDDRDPGGGPCRATKVSVDVVIDESVLPEAQSNDDD